MGSCPSCLEFALPSVRARVNPRGLGSLQLWQTDVTHYAPFGRQKYIHSQLQHLTNVGDIEYAGFPRGARGKWGNKNSELLLALNAFIP